MTCECVSVQYPSNKLLPLVNAAIENQKTELELLSTNRRSRIKEYKSFPWYKRVVKKDPEDPCGESWSYHWNRSMHDDALRCLNSIRLSAEAGDTVWINGDTLAKIDEWAGN